MAMMPMKTMIPEKTILLMVEGSQALEAVSA